MKIKKRVIQKVETIRLNKTEQMLISEKTMEINKIRVLNGIEPISKSDMVHMLIGANLTKVKCNEYGEVVIE